MKFALPLTLLMILHTFFILVNAYAIPHLDSAMHFAGGITLGMFIMGLLGLAIGRGWCPDPGRILLFLLLVCLVTTGAVTWEIYEWLSDRYLDTHFQVSLADTMKDLVLGMAGATVYAGLVSQPGTPQRTLQPADGEHKS
jgi:hypothetical protein